jgi:hypothetical protein
MWLVMLIWIADDDALVAVLELIFFVFFGVLHSAISSLGAGRFLPEEAIAISRAGRYQESYFSQQGHS